MKKLLIMTHNMAGGGCERVIALLAGAFAARGIEVMIATEYAAPCAYALDPRVALRPLTEDPVCRTRDIPRVYAALRRVCRKFRPDAVLAMPEKVNVWTVLALLLSGTPVIVSERNDPARHPESRVKRLLRRLVYPAAAGFIFQTEEARSYFPARIRRRGVVLDNPLDCRDLPAPYTDARDRVIVGAGRLDGQKNFALLIRAFTDFYAAHPDWRLVIYGEGGAREALEEMASALPAGAVTLPGRTEQLARDMQRAGMFVLSSDFEGMPNVLIEAMAMGLPAISTDCASGGPRALIRDRENGLLVPVGDRAALGGAMARLADDAALAARLGARAAELRDRVSLARVSEKWREYIESIAASQ